MIGTTRQYLTAQDQVTQINKEFNLTTKTEEAIKTRNNLLIEMDEYEIQQKEFKRSLKYNPKKLIEKELKDFYAGL